MNDAPQAAPLASLLNIEGNRLINALSNAIETRPAKAESGSHDAQSPVWIHRYKKSRQPPEHKLFDQTWLSPVPASGLGEAYIDPRTKHGGNGSDHDPAWIELDI